MATSRNHLRKHTARKLAKMGWNDFRQVPREEWGHNAPPWMTRLFRNNLYIVMVNDNAPMSDGTTRTLALLQRNDSRPVRKWEELQKVKNAIFGKETWACEFYPPEDALINTHHCYWLYILEGDVTPERF